MGTRTSKKQVRDTLTRSDTHTAALVIVDVIRLAAPQLALGRLSRYRETMCIHLVSGDKLLYFIMCALTALGARNAGCASDFVRPTGFVSADSSKESSSLSQHARTNSQQPTFLLLASCQGVILLPHTHTRLHSELTPGLAHGQNHNASYTRCQASISSGRVCVWLMIHGITVVVEEGVCVFYSSDGSASEQPFVYISLRH